MLSRISSCRLSLHCRHSRHCPREPQPRLRLATLMYRPWATPIRLRSKIRCWRPRAQLQRLPSHNRSSRITPGFTKPYNQGLNPPPRAPAVPSPPPTSLPSTRNTCCLPTSTVIIINKMFISCNGHWIDYWNFSVEMPTNYSTQDLFLKCWIDWRVRFLQQLNIFIDI